MKRFNGGTLTGLFRPDRAGQAAVQTVLVNIVIQGLNVITGVLTAHALGAAGRGELAAVGLWPQVLAFGMTLGVPPALVLNLRRRSADSANLFGATLCVAPALGVLGALVGVCGLPYWLAGHPPHTVHLAQAYVLSTPLVLMGLMFNGVLQARGDYTRFNLCRTLVPLLTLLLLSGLLVIGRLTPTTAAMAFAAPQLPLIAWLLGHLWRAIGPSFAHVGRATRQLLVAGAHFIGVDLLGTLAGYVDRVVVIAMLGHAEIGIYAVALSLSRVLEVFSAAANAVVFPKACGRPLPEVVEIVGRAVRLTAGITGAVAAIVALLGPVALRLLYGRDFVPAVSAVRILLIEVTLAAITDVLCQAFLATGRANIVTYLKGIGLGVSVMMLILLVPRYGLVGAAVAQVMATTVRLAGVVLAFPLVLKVRVPRVLPVPGEFVHFARQLSFDSSRAG